MVGYRRPLGGYLHDAPELSGSQLKERTLVISGGKRDGKETIFVVFKDTFITVDFDKLTIIRGRKV